MNNSDVADAFRAGAMVGESLNRPLTLTLADGVLIASMSENDRAVFLLPGDEVFERLRAFANDCT